MSEWIVYSKDGLTERCRLKKLEYAGSYMNERTVTATFEYHSEVAFEVFDYIVYRGERFELEAIPSVKKTSRHNYEYELRFVSLKYELERCEMRDIVPNDNGVTYPSPLSFSFTGSVRYLAERIQANLDSLYGKGVWTISVASEASNEEKNITISQQNCWNALSLVNTSYGLDFSIKGRNITIGKKQSVVSHVFQYGKGNGLYEIERVADTNTGIVTKLRAYGSTRNLDYSYPKKPEWADSVLPVSFILSPLRLMLPSFKLDGKTDYIMANDSVVEEYGIRESSMIYEDIYPTITDVVNSNGDSIDEIMAVEEVDDSSPTFVIHLYDLGFDLESHLTTEDAQISMKSGAMQGYTFNISKIEKQEDNTYKITLGRITTDSSNTGNYDIPNSQWGMSAGDKFVLLNILMPQEYIRAAEQRLLERAQEYLAEYGKTNFSYNIGLNDKFLKEHENIYDELIEGSKLSVYDEELGIREEVTIQSITIDDYMEDNILPQVKVTLNNKPSASTLERIQGKINELSDSASNSFSTQTELLQQYRKKLDKPFFDRLFAAVDKDGKEIPSTDLSTPISYIKARFSLASLGGITMYLNDKSFDLPSIYDGLPIDSQTIYWEDIKDGNGVVIGKILKAKTGGGTLGSLTNVGEWADSIADVDRIMVQKKGSDTWEAMDVSGIGSASFENISESGEGNAYTSFELSEDKKFLTLVKGETFALASDLEDKWTTDEELINNWNTAFGWGNHAEAGYALQTSLDLVSEKLNNFLEGSDTDSIINKWKELEVFLGGLTESDNLAEILATKANQSALDETNKTLATKWTKDDDKIANWDAAFSWGDHSKAGYAAKSYVDSTFVTIAGNEDVTGVHNFVNGLKIGGKLIDKPQDDVIYIDANLVVRGGITMYGDENANIPSILESIPTAGYDDIQARGLIAFNSKHFVINNGVVSAIQGSAGLDVEQLDNHLKNNHYATEDWVKEYIVEINTGETVNITQQMVIDALGFTPYDASNPNGYITSATLDGYLPLTGGTMNGHITLPNKKYIRTESNSYAILGYDGYKFILSAPNKPTNIRSNGTLTHNNYTIWDSGNFNPTNYLPLTGGTITINEYQGLTIKRDSTNDVPLLWFSNNSGNLGAIGVTSNKSLYFDNGTTAYDVYHTGNLTKLSQLTDDIAAGKYLPLQANAASATKLQTPRTIWGQSFDGTGDVDGTIKINAKEDIFEAIAIHNDWYTTDSVKYTDIRLLSHLSGQRGGVIRVGTGNYGMFNSMSFGFLNGVDNYTPYMFINNQGNVGIGTENPSSKLHVYGGATPIMCESNTSESSIYFVGAGTGSGYKWAIGKGIWGIGGKFGIGEYNTAKTLFVQIDTNGYVGIGVPYKNSPSERLHVNGNILSTGTITTNASLTINGINIRKTQDGVLYLDGNLVVKGGVTMYGTDATSAPSILNSLPIASTSAKGIAQFSGDYFTVSDGIVRIIDGSVGLKESELNAILDGKNYATKTDLSEYLPLTGGTISGDLTIKKENGESTLLLGTNGRVVYNPTEDTTTLFNGGSGFPALKVQAGLGHPIFRYDYKNYTIIHSGNIGNYALNPDGSNRMTAGIRWESTEGSEDYSVYGNGFRILGYNAKTNDYRGGISVGTRYGWQLVCNGFNNTLQARFRVVDTTTWADWKTIAFTDSNVASATKLVTDNTTAVPNTLYASAGGNNVVFGFETAKAGFDTFLGGRNITLRIFDGESNKGGIVVNSSANVTIGGSNMAGDARLYVDGHTFINSYLALANNNGIYFKDAEGTIRAQVYANPNNNVTFGYGTTQTGANSFLYGTNIYFGTSTTRAERMCITESGNVGIGTISPSEKLHVNGNVKAENGNFIGNLTGTASNAEKFAGVDFATLVSIIPTNTNQLENGAGFITSSGYSAGVTDYYDRTSNISIGYQSSSLTASQIDYIAAYSIASGNIVIKDVDKSTMQSWLGLGSLAYKSSLVASDIPSLDWSKITSGKPTTISGYGITDAITTSNIGSQSVSYATSSGSCTGNAASATKLSDNTSYTAWGQIFFTNGKPKNVSGALSEVTGITMTGGINQSSGENRFSAGSTFTDPVPNVAASTKFCGLIAQTGGNALLCTTSGTVGIGTASPSYKLDILNSASTNYDFHVYNSSTISSFYVGRDLWYGTPKTTGIIFSINSGCSSDGGGGINVFTVSADGNVLSKGGITMYSQRSLKNIQDERGLSLSELSVIKPTRYTWKDGRDNNIHFGGIADDIQQVLPEVIYKTADGTLTMDYGNAGFAIAASLIKPVVDHEEKIRQLQKRVSELEQELNRLRA